MGRLGRCMAPTCAVRPAPPLIFAPLSCKPAEMPLTPEQIKVVVDNLQCVDPPRRRRAFEALRPLLGLDDSEMDAEFERVQGVLRYASQLERDRAALRRVHMHAVPCKVQAALSCRRLT